MVSFSFRAMIWMFVSSAQPHPRPYVEILVPTVMVLWGGAFGGHEVTGVEPSCMEVNGPIKRPQRAPLLLPPREDTAEVSSLQPWRGLSQPDYSGTLTLTSGLQNQKSGSVVCKPPCLWYFVTAAQTNWDIL